MTRAVDPNHLGGIALMLEVARACPRCGKRLADHPSAATQHFITGGCRPTVFAALPEPEPRLQDDEFPPVPASRLIQDFETPAARGPRASVFSVLDPVPTPRENTRSLAIPWLRPPDLGEVL